MTANCWIERVEGFRGMVDKHRVQLYDKYLGLLLYRFTVPGHGWENGRRGMAPKIVVSSGIYIIV
jgi:hypothetical protein